MPHHGSVDQLSCSSHFIWLCLTLPVYLFHKLSQIQFCSRGLLCQITHSAVQRLLISHLPLLRTKPIAPNLGLDCQKMVHDDYHPAPWFCSLELEIDPGPCSTWPPPQKTLIGFGPQNISSLQHQQICNSWGLPAMFCWLLAAGSQ